MEWVHGLKLIDGLARLAIQAVIPNVTDDPDNHRPGSTLLLRSELDPMADRIRTRKPGSCERFTDQRSRYTDAVVIGQKPAALQWNLEHAKVVGRDPEDVCRRRLGIAERRLLLETHFHRLRVAERNIADHADGRDTGDDPNALDDLRVVPEPVLRRREPAARGNSGVRV